jgi:predicted metal-dependent HD superfamily phosphohydrolase
VVSLTRNEELFDMLEKSFKSEVLRYNLDQQLANNLWNQVSKEYSRPSRYYHNLHHLEKMYAELLHVREFVDDWCVLVFSLVYHDIVYNPLKKNNEEKSAAFAYGQLTTLTVPEEKKQKCTQQILATKSHQYSSASDTNFFIDADLCILGADAESYSTYISQIRKEYHIYPDLIYKPGRKKVLLHFLWMDYIFKTGYFREKYEHQARQNLLKELETL